MGINGVGAWTNGGAVLGWFVWRGGWTLWSGGGNACIGAGRGL